MWWHHTPSLTPQKTPLRRVSVAEGRHQGLEIAGVATEVATGTERIVDRLGAEPGSASSA
jgi:hypothetical protein